ncbi:hypothetical protein Tco_0735270 [Tanacetum coccineum]
MVELFLNIEKEQIFEILFRDLVFLVISSAKDYLSQIVVSIFFKHLDTDHTENSHLRSDCFTIRGLTVFVDVEFLSSKPPVSDAIGRTDVIFAFTFNPTKKNIKKKKIELILNGPTVLEYFAEFDDPQDYPNQPYSSAAYGIHPSDIEERRCSYERL